MVGALIEVVDIDRVREIADAYRHRHCADLWERRLDRVTCSLRGGGCLGALRVDDPGEFLAADTADQLTLPPDVERALANFAQDGVADDVPWLTSRMVPSRVSMQPSCIEMVIAAP